jgi:predicted PhzF superfamily epimerase YddE/YHI9
MGGLLLHVDAFTDHAFGGNPAAVVVLDAAAEPDGAWTFLDFPALPSRPVEAPPELGRALGASPDAVARTEHDYLVELGSEAAVRRLRPDPVRLRAVDTRGVIVNAPADAPDVDFVSRFFAPRVGIDEDAVTGSAHCALAPYWSARLGKQSFVARQVSARGGVVRAEWRGERVRLGGQAVTLARGVLV